MQVHTNAFAGADFTDKPVPNAFWRAFAALIYIIPCIDTFTLGTTVYNIFPQMIVIAIAGCAPPAQQLVLEQCTDALQQTPAHAQQLRYNNSMREVSVTE